MITKIAYDVEQPKFDRKIGSDSYLVLPLYINRSITKKFPIKHVFKTIDYSIKNLGEVEYN